MQRLIIIMVALVGCTGSEEAATVVLPVTTSGDAMAPATTDLGYQVQVTQMRVAVSTVQFTIEGDPHGLTVLHLAAGKLPQTALVFVIGSPGDQDASIDTPNHRCCDMHTLHPFTSCNAA